MDILVYLGLKDEVKSEVPKSLVGGTVNPCVVPKQSGEPCDIQSLVIEHLQHSPMSKQKGQPRKATYVRDGLSKGKGELSVSQPYQLIAGPKLNVKTVKIKVWAEPGDIKKYCKKHKHPLMMFRKPHEPRYDIDGKTAKEATVFRQARFYDKYVKGQGVDTPLSLFWLADTSPSTFWVRVETCGRNADGKSVTRDLAVPIEVYPEDEFEVKLTIPPMGVIKKEKKTSVVHADGKTHTQQEYTSTKGKGTSLTKQQKNTCKSIKIKGEDGKYRADGEAERKQKTSTDDVKFTITRKGYATNGDPLNIAFDLGKMLRGVKALADKIAEVNDLLENKVKIQAQAGFGFEWSGSLFGLTISGDWGYKEHTDHRVFFGYSAKLKGTLIKLSAGLNFGVEFKILGKGLTAKITGTISGSLALECGFIKDSPDSPPKTEGKTKATALIEGSIKIDLTLFDGKYCKANGKAVTGLQFDFFFLVDPSPHLHVKPKWTGLKVSGSVKVWPWIEFSGSHQVCDEKKWSSWNIPDPYKGKDQQ